MSDDNPHSTNGSARKTWATKLLQLFTGEPNSREELVDLIQDAEERDLIDNDTKEMIEGVLDVAELKVRDIMVPRSQMVTIDVNQSVESFLPIVIDSQHSRYPVVSENKDHVEGILLAKDLLAYGFGMTDHEFALSEVIRPAVIVPESKRVDVLLKEFRSQRYHMAIVVDEYGGVSGLVTIEDILEEIVGEIEDETDYNEDNKADIRRINKSRYSVKALTTIVMTTSIPHSATKNMTPLAEWSPMDLVICRRSAKSSPLAAFYLKSPVPINAVFNNSR